MDNKQIKKRVKRGKNYNSRYSVNSKKEILTLEDVYACNLLCFLLIYTILITDASL